MVQVLFVCLGNICRSPTGEGVFRHLVASEGLAELVRTDSAGTAAYHVGQAPDPRTVAAAARRGYDLSDLRGRQVHRGDFQSFDLVLAADRSNMEDLLRICPPDRQDRLRMFLDFAAGFEETEVPDPYHLGPDGFETVLDMVEDASRGLLAELTR